MRRRTVLAAAPALLVGCLDAGGGPATSTSTRTMAEPTDAPTTTIGIQTTAATTTEPHALLPADPTSMTAGEVRTRLADRDCGALRDRRTVCPGDDAGLDVSVSRTVADVAGGTVKFTVENARDDPFVFNPYQWQFHKWDGGAWRRIAPAAAPAPLDRIAPDNSHIYRISVDNSTFRGLDEYRQQPVNVALSGIGPGVYGFSVGGYFESAPDDELAAGAVFGLAGEGPPVRPTDDVARVERDGPELRVYANESGNDGEEFVISIVDGEADTHLLPEHVLQVRALRNTLPYAATDGVETIRYLGDQGQIDDYLRAVAPEGTTRYGFRDLVFEAGSG